jgi:hypothetical protein
MSLTRRLDKIAATLAAKSPPREIIVHEIIEGVDDPDEVLARMVADGAIAEHQKGDVQFIVRSIIEPVWEMNPDGGARLVGRRNLYTGEVEKVEWGNPEQPSAGRSG